MLNLGLDSIFEKLRFLFTHAGFVTLINEYQVHKKTLTEAFKTKYGKLLLNKKAQRNVSTCNFYC